MDDIFWKGLYKFSCFSFIIYSGHTGLLDASRLTSDSTLTTSEEEPSENEFQVQLLNTPDLLEVSDDKDSRPEQGRVSAEEQQGTQRRSLLEMVVDSFSEGQKHNDRTSYV